jgi:hypothetical protein
MVYAKKSHAALRAFPSEKLLRVSERDEKKFLLFWHNVGILDGPSGSFKGKLPPGMFSGEE